FGPQRHSIQQRHQASGPVSKTEILVDISIQEESMFALCLRRLDSVAVLLAFCSTMALAQTTASLNGSITDATGAIIPGAKVIVTNTGTGLQREAASDSAGLYDVRLLQPGTYNITVQKEGFRQIRREGMRLEVNQAARIDFRMELGAVSETVEVK